MNKEKSNFYRHFKQHHKRVNYRSWVVMIVVCVILMITEFIVITHEDYSRNMESRELKSLHVFNTKINSLHDRATYVGDVLYDMTYQSDSNGLLKLLSKNNESFNRDFDVILSNEYFLKKKNRLHAQMTTIFQQKELFVGQISELLKNKARKDYKTNEMIASTDGHYHLMVNLLSQLNDDNQNEINKLLLNETENLNSAHLWTLIIGIALFISCCYVGYFGIYIARESLTLKDLFVQQSFALDQSAIVAVTDSKGIIEFVNENFKTVTGYSENELVGKDVRMLNSGKHPKDFFRSMWITISAGNIWKGEVQNRRKDGSLYWVDTSIVPLRRTSENIIDGYIVIRYDITDKKAIQDDLVESQKRLEMALTTSGLGVWDWNIKTDEFICSNEFASLLHYSLVELNSSWSSFFAFIHPDDQAKFNKAINEHVTLTKVLSCEIRIKLQDGGYHWFHLTGQCEWSKDWKSIPQRLLGGIRDINDLYLSRIEMVEAKILAERSNQLKSSFLANMSHEIRTPMNAIIGMAELLGDSPLSANQRKYVEIFKKSGESLLGIINDVLDISKIESGYLKINQEGCDLRECVKDVIELAKINIKNKNIYLASFVDPKLNTAILADTLRIQQVLLNIIGNGLKFTTIGGVLLTVKENLNTSHRGNILFTIRDTGMGIPSEHMTSLFSPFVQGDSSITKKFGGTGLGLALSKHLIEMMGGDIWVESEKDSGTVFYFTVQAEQAPDSLMGELKLLKDMADHSREIENEIVNISPLNILLVDDSEDNRLIAKAYLSNLNYHIVEAENGLEAIAKYKKEEFDLVFMDIQMPILDGVSATKEIRLFEKTSGKPRSIIVALTAYAQEDDEKRFLDIGCDIHLPKPIKKDVFQKVMRQALKLMQS